MIDKSSISKKNKYLLSPNSFSNDDIIKASKVLFSKKITMGNITKIFEKKFAKFIGSKYALMVNSGSSANLLAMFALINPLKKNYLKPGDECLIPALCWSTSLWPLIQCGLKPKFLDVNINNYCLDEKLLKRDKNTKIENKIFDGCSLKKVSKP